MALQSHLSCLDNFPFAKNNLDLLLTDKSNSRDDSNLFITKKSGQNFTHIQESTLGWGHTIRKYAMTGFVHASCLFAPIMGVGAAIYYNKDYMLSLTGLSSSEGAKILLGILAINAAFEKVFDCKFTTVCGIAACRVWDTIGVRASEELLGSYARLEKKSEEDIARFHEEIKGDLALTYGGMAKELYERYCQASANPKLAREIQANAKYLEVKMPTIVKAFGLLGLSSVEVDVILEPLNVAIDQIKDGHKKFKSQNSEEDGQYNAQLMADFTSEEFAKCAIPQSVYKAIEEASQRQLGAIHTVKSYSVSLLSGMAAAACTVASVGGLALLAFNQEIDSTRYENIAKCLLGTVSQCLYDEKTQKAAGVAVVAGCLAVGVLARVTSHKLKTYNDERTQSDETVATILFEAIEELKSLYDGIAEYLEEIYDVEKSELPFKGISEKLSILDEKILATGLVKNPLDITKRLRDVVRRKQDLIDAIGQLEDVVVAQN